MPPQFFFRMGGYGIKLSSLVLLPATISGDALTMNKYTAEELNHLVMQEDEPASSDSQSLGHMLSHIFQPFSIPLPDLSTLRIPLKNILHHNELKAEPKLLANPTATRTWTVAHTYKALPGSEVKRKLDLLLSDEIMANWGNIRVSAELTHSSYQPVLRLVKAADGHAYLMLSEQPWRCFVLVLSLTNKYQELRVLFYDHAGGVVSPAFNIYQKPSIVAHIIAALHFSSLE
ncbi:uncharacterized protein F5891DRAFT_1199124 [Suillus fuscotomentosus]|uniref:Fungal-type protein kinase domain-containing protein n=1 Tax=Suillus fuscotomentosus TaxID=1912939 RepID=A0AAD4DPT5_9AGAM|nr:uncharacterized protein F5891DRAFT_1199124 [Suillus fuscotomentosus]KAG1888894.1 hypothetical protein F5891DRAFT_1199124 [Suillus fuscotomentosus]